jgi:DNA-binding CsgD family transcriptional regulator
VGLTSRTPLQFALTDCEAARGPLAVSNDTRIAPDQVLALFAANDLEALIDSTFDVLKSVVSSEFVSAFYRNVGNGLLSERDSRGRQYSTDFMRRYVELTPALPLAMANRGIKIMPSSQALPHSPRELQKMAFYREIMQPQGWRYAVALCFWGQPLAESPIFVASVYRSGGQSDFSKDEVATLARTHQFLDCAVNRLHERHTARAVKDAMALTVEEGPRGVAILDRNYLVVQASASAHRLCFAWDQTSRGEASSAWRLPAAVLVACRELHDEWVLMVRGRQDGTVGSVRRISHPSLSGLTATVTIVCTHHNDLAEPTFVIEFDRMVHGVSLDTLNTGKPIFKNMTQAERAVAIVLADGLSNQEIADQLGKSVAAVKFQLHRIYQRTGLPNRAALVATLRSRPGS